MDADHEGYIYIMAKIGDGARDFIAPVKVGMTTSLGGRLGTIQTAAPFPIGIFHAFTFPNKEMALEVEQGFHKCCARFRSHGEWYDLAPKKAAFLMAANLRAWMKVRLGFDKEECKEFSDYSITAWERRRHGSYTNHQA